MLTIYPATARRLLTGALYSTVAEQQSTTPWHAAFPAPALKAPVGSITPQELAQKLQNGAGGKDVLVVDVRRTDFENHFVRGAINLPAHSLYPTLSGVVPLLSRYPLVVFHCNSCSAGGRGVRSAGWYQEAVEKAGLDGQTSGVILEGGIKGWVAAFGGDEQLTSKL